MRQAHKLLQLVEEKYPLKGKAHHNITLDKGRFTLTVFHNDLWWVVFLDDADEDMQPEALMLDIVKHLEQRFGE